jgi:hypothetical protein
MSGGWERWDAPLSAPLGIGLLLPHSECQHQQPRHAELLVIVNETAPAKAIDVRGILVSRGTAAEQSNQQALL